MRVCPPPPTSRPPDLRRWGVAVAIRCPALYTAHRVPLLVHLCGCWNALFDFHCVGNGILPPPPPRDALEEGRYPAPLPGRPAYAQPLSP